MGRRDGSAVGFIVGPYVGALDGAIVLQEFGDRVGLRVGLPGL